MINVVVVVVHRPLYSCTARFSHVKAYDIYACTKSIFLLFLTSRELSHKFRRCYLGTHNLSLKIYRKYRWSFKVGGFDISIHKVYVQSEIVWLTS